MKQYSLLQKASTDSIVFMVAFPGIGNIADCGAGICKFSSVALQS
jgi:hypothetical protein